MIHLQSWDFSQEYTQQREARTPAYYFQTAASIAGVQTATGSWGMVLQQM